MTGPLRFGIVGTENTHVDQIVDYLNLAESPRAARVVALAGGRSDRNLELAARGGIPTIVDESIDLLGSVDALIVTNPGRWVTPRPGGPVPGCRDPRLGGQAVGLQCH